jgi:hypothetical protein
MTENMVGAICASVVLIAFIGFFAWLTNRQDERDAERLFFSETGKVPKRYLK